MPSRALRVAILLCAGCFAAAGSAACVRYVPDPKQPPGFDGPGSFGKLQDTVTLDCLAYVGSIGQAGAEQVLIRDDRGEVHRLRVGDYMGENSGVIRKIDADAIYIEQVLPDGNATKTRTVKFAKAAKPEAR
jgi:hypothetical protein